MVPTLCPSTYFQSGTTSDTTNRSYSSSFPLSMLKLTVTRFDENLQFACQSAATRESFGYKNNSAKERNIAKKLLHIVRAFNPFHQGLMAHRWRLDQNILPLRFNHKRIAPHKAPVVNLHKCIRKCVLWCWTHHPPPSRLWFIHRNKITISSAKLSIAV